MKVKIGSEEISFAAIACVTFLTAWALWLGYDTAIYTTAISAIAGLAGWRIGKRQRK